MNRHVNAIAAQVGTAGVSMKDSREGAKARNWEPNVEVISSIIVDGASTFKEGCKRIVNQHQDFASSRLRVNQNGGGR